MNGSKHEEIRTARIMRNAAFTRLETKPKNESRELTHTRAPGCEAYVVSTTNEAIKSVTEEKKP